MCTHLIEIIVSFVVQNWCDRKSRSLLSSSLSKFSPQLQSATNNSGSILRQGLSSLLPTTPEITTNNSTTSKLLDIGGSMSSPDHSEKSPDKIIEMPKNNESPTGSNLSEGDKVTLTYSLMIRLCLKRLFLMYRIPRRKRKVKIKKVSFLFTAHRTKSSN